MRSLLLALPLTLLACNVMPDEVTIYGSHTQSDSISGSFGGKHGSSGTITGGGDSDTIGLAFTYYVRRRWGGGDDRYRRVHNDNAGYFDLPDGYAVHPIEIVKHDDGHAEILAGLSGEEEEDWIDEAARAGKMAGSMPWMTIAKIAAIVIVLGGLTTLAYHFKNGIGWFAPKEPKA